MSLSQIARAALMAFCDIDSTAVEDELRAMVKEGFVEVVGADAT